MKRRLTLSLSLFLAFIVAADAQMLQHRRKAFRVVGGPDVWYDSIAPGSTNSDSSVSNQGFSLGARVTVTTGGTATKVRMRAIFVNDTAASVKVGLFSTTGTRLAQGTKALTAEVNDSWIEVTLSVPVAVTSATTYIVGWMCSNAVGFTGRHLSGAASGTGVAEFSETYAGYPSASISFSDLTTQFSAGVFVD